MHGKGNEVREAGLLGITEGVREALNNKGISLAERYSKAIEEGFNKHVEYNIAHPEARLEWKKLLSIIRITSIPVILFKRFFKKSYTRKTPTEEALLQKNVADLISERKQILKSPALLNSSREKEVNDYIADLSKYERYIAAKLNEIGNNTTNISDQERTYFQIIANKNNDNFLRDIVQSTNNNNNSRIEHKLYAYMLLRILGLEEVEQDTKERLILDLLNSIRKKEFIIRDDGSVNFNLKALITGIDLILTSILSKTIQGFSLDSSNPSIVKLYKNRIPEALFLDIDGINQGNSSLVFAKSLLSTFPTLCECISHELGHNYLEALGFDDRDSFTNNTYDEFFAFTIQGLFNDAITHGKITRSVRKVFSVLSFNLYSLIRLLFKREVFVWMESIETPSISIATISMRSLLITGLSRCLYINAIGGLIPIGYIMRRCIPSIEFGMKLLAHVDALSLLRTVEIADSKGLNFLVTTKLAIEFFKAGGRVGYNNDDPEYKMVDKFIKFTLNNLEEIHNEILEKSLDDENLTKDEILILIKLRGVSKEAVKKNIKKSYGDGVKLTNGDIVDALKENKVLTESDVEDLLKTKETKNEEEIDKEIEDKELQLPFLILQGCIKV
jgi:hypothetical protein